MKRTNLYFIVDVMAFIGFVVLTTTGVLMRYILPPGSGKHSTIWGLDRHEWGDIHFMISVAFFAVLALHLVQHWRWIVNVVTGRPRDDSGFRVGLGIVGLVAVVALSISPLLTPIERDVASKGLTSIYKDEHGDTSIRGSMTFNEIEEATGVPAVYIIESLKLPESTSEDERLGPLKREYGFEMNDVREIVKGYQGGK
jgi:hypothetical protein